MSDLVDRLRDPAENIMDLLDEAADRIKELEADRARLDWQLDHKATVRWLHGRWIAAPYDGGHAYGDTTREAIDAAREATP